MIPEVTTDQIERFRTVLERRTGLAFEDAKLGFLGEVLRQRIIVAGRAPGAYLEWLGATADSDEIAALAEKLTVPETYFFRNIDQFHAFAEQVVPERSAARGNGGRLQILSAGCASGEEPYTLAILLREIMGDTSPISIRAVDINPAMLERARRARYSSFSLRETPAEMQERWFSLDGRDVVLNDSIRRAVTFHRGNLAENDPDLWPPEYYDVVFCRNVIMYLTPDTARRLVERITRALVPGGYLFLGHAETLRGLSSEFHLCHTHGTFYYRRNTALGAIDLPSPPTVERSQAERPAETEDPTWMGAIRMATEQIERLTRSSPPRTQPLPTGTRGGGWDLGQALGLLGQERIAEALDLVDNLPAEAATDTDVLLLQAVLLTHGGLLDRAEETCRRLLAIDDLNAGAHYLLALCREGAGDLAGAAEQDRVAVYLDPGFAMPRMHLGLLARRAGRVDVARRELGQALTLLQREDSSRILLFGGGFGRETLIALCRAEFETRSNGQ